FIDLWLERRLRLNRNQLHFEDQRLFRTNRAFSRWTIGEIGRNEELPLGSYGHQLQSFRPAFDYAAQREGGRLVAFVGAVELGAVDEGPTIIANHGIAGCGLGTGAWSEDLVLQTVRQSLDAFF